MVLIGYEIGIEGCFGSNSGGEGEDEELELGVDIVRFWVV